jgi:SAM-dependent methyltransferase
MTSESIHEDPKTAAFFDSHQPTYATSRLDFVIEGLAGGSSDARLIDIGAGDGANLRYILDNSELTDVTGLDVSSAYVDRIKADLGCEAICGSILDDDFVGERAGQYDVAVMAAVLHHIVGDTRAESRAMATKAVANSLRLLAPGGRFFLFEPCYEPRQALTGVFWTKQLFAKAFSGRFELGPSWFNIGEPIVSYYGPDEVFSMIEQAGATHEVKARRSKRLAGLIKRSPLGIEVRP